MVTKIVYVLSSDDSDIYLEQTLLSVFSLRKHNPDAFVELVVDERTNNTIQGKRSELLNYINYKNVVAVPDKYNKIQTSRWLKTSLRKHVDGNFLFIDSDTIITDDLSSIDVFEGDIGAVPDAHVPMGHTPFNNSLRVLSKLDGWTYNENSLYFNSGVIFVRDSEVSMTLFDKWHMKWGNGTDNGGHVSDQSYLASSNEETGFVIRELYGSCNCMLARNGLSYLANAKIIHYLGFSFHSQCPPWSFYDKNIYWEIKETGKITQKISFLIDNAKCAFPESNGIVASDEAIVTRSRLFRFLMKNMWIVSSFEKMSRFFKK